MSTSNVPPAIDLTRSIDLRPGKDPVRERAQVAQLAQEFEAMLMLQMIRGMRQSMLDEEAEGDGFGGDTLGDTFDVELTRQMARAGGVGFATWMAEQVARQSGGEQTTGETGEIGALTGRGSHPLHAASPAVPLGGESAITLPARPSASHVSEPRHISAIDDRQADTATDNFRLSMPLESVTTSAYGWRRHPISGRQSFHRGVDLRAAYGDDVPAAAAGTVVFAGDRGGYGNLVVLRHENGMETRYAHLSSIDVAEGASVAAGETLGRAGSTGRSTAPHLHFEVLVNGERVNPERVAARLGRGPLKFVSQADD